MSTAQNRQARVQTEPSTMIVAVPAFQHSPIFGHIASSQTVDRRCSRTIRRTSWYAAPPGRGAFNQRGLPPGARAGASPRALMPFLTARMPCAVVYFDPLLTIGMPLNSAT